MRMWNGKDPHEIELRTLNPLEFFDMTCDCDTSMNMALMPVARLWNIAAKLLKPILHGRCTNMYDL